MRTPPDEPLTDPTDPAENDTHRRATVRDLLRITEGHRKIIAVALGIALTGAVLGLIQPIVASRTIGQFERSGPTGFWGAAGWWLVLLAVVFIAEAVITGIGHYVLERTGERIVLGLRLHIVGRLLRWPLRRYQRHRIGDLLTRTTADTTLLRDTLAYDLVDAGVGLFIIVGGVVMMIWLDALMFGIVFAIVGAIGGLTTLLLRGIRRSTEDAQDNLGAMGAELERALSAIRTVRVMRAEDREAERIGEFAHAAYASNLGVLRRNAIIAPAMTLATHGAMIAVLVVGGLRVASGQASLPTLVAFLLYVSYLIYPVLGIFTVLADVQRGMAALQRVQEVTGLPVEQELEARTESAPEAGAPAAQESPAAIEFKDVDFAYEPGQPVLERVSFRVEPRTHAALVGPSGAGKSTIFALIARLFDPDAGTIRIGGADIVHGMSVAECRARIGLVEQGVPIMHGTLRDNITYARPDAPAEEIDRAVRLASLEPLVARLPLGLDTPVGEHGSTLSGGEQQRVAIARALLPRPEVLLLDEPTSHLDPGNEAALSRTITQIRGECTLLVIAHRGSTIDAADQLIVLEQGRVLAHGHPGNVVSLDEATGTPVSKD